MPHIANLQAYRVRRCFTMHGQDNCALTAPLPCIDNALLVVQNQRVAYVGPYTPKALPAGFPIKDVQDLGEGVLVPAVVNAHTHVQLAHMAGRTTWHKGFVSWLKSLMALLGEPYDARAIAQSVQAMAHVGTGYFADYGHGGLHFVAKAVQECDLRAIFLAEWIGFADVFSGELGLPARTQAIFEHFPKSQRDCCIPCGHALYSTSAQILQKAHAWCSAQSLPHKRPFALHLAEFPEEVEALSTGQGHLVDLFKSAVLPEDWQAPALHPVDFALKLGLLTENTLVVHGVQVEKEHIQRMRHAGVSLCLCPRSNAALAVGTAPVAQYLDSGMNVCLGTDGLSSNTDLDVWQEAVYLQKKMDVPVAALLRMLTVNGAKALGVANDVGMLYAGGKACWALAPKTLEI